MKLSAREARNLRRWLARHPNVKTFRDYQDLNKKRIPSYIRKIMNKMYTMAAFTHHSQFGE